MPKNEQLEFMLSQWQLYKNILRLECMFSAQIETFQREFTALPIRVSQEFETISYVLLLNKKWQ